MTQNLYPDADVAAASWTTTPLYQKVDEEPYSDSDYIFYDAGFSPGANSTCELSLDSGTDPGDHTNHILRVRMKRSGFAIPQGTANIYIYQGGTKIAEKGNFSLTTSFADYTLALTTGEAANITDYTDLRVKIKGTNGTGTNDFYCSWVRFDIPDAGASPITINLDAAALTASGQVISIVPAAVSVSLNAASLTASGQVLGVAPGAAVVSLDAGSLVAAGQVLSVVPGAVTVELGAGNLVAAGQVLSVIPGAAVIELAAAALTAAGQVISIYIPSPLTINLNAATITASGQALSVVPGAVSIDLSVGNLLASGQAVSVVPGAATIELAAAALTASGQAITIFTTGLRILPDGEIYGNRILYVNKHSLGGGDYTTIQAAIDIAQGETPAANSRWLVMVSPGEYQETLTLYDYVDIAGYSPGYSAHLVSPASAAAIDNGAECTISNLNISGENDPIIRTGSSFSGNMSFINCVSDNDHDEVMLFQLVSGTVETYFCHFTTQGRTFYATTGTLKTYNSVFTRDGEENEPPLEIAGGATIEAILCSFLNTGPGGGPAVKITTGSPTSVIFHSCVFRLASGTYSIDGTTGTPAIYLANCVANAAIDPAFTGTHDVQVDPNF